MCVPSAGSSLFFWKAWCRSLVLKRYLEGSLSPMAGMYVFNAWGTEENPLPRQLANGCVRVMGATNQSAGALGKAGGSAA
ncbi:hypothetical protein MPNT_140010 [Candidatus Methylacidithermus pantelleriae]|uniref:Uncharacterized protein n=1 Tax=Candidatus Methylacidithermus pantelleriae TaxID=2744239 RepID=A0A8J2BID3_9BACT|nr:hypothetical protein MPNT_140010 [Candidatus Methylacidithermus pantelleriae]